MDLLLLMLVDRWEKKRMGSGVQIPNSSATYMIWKLCVCAFSCRAENLKQDLNLQLTELQLPTW